MTKQELIKKAKKMETASTIKDNWQIMRDERGARKSWALSVEYTDGHREIIA